MNENVNTEFIRVFNKGNFSIAALTEKEKWGSNIKSMVHITPDYTEATNGHYLIRVERPEVKREEIPNGKDGEEPIEMDLMMLMSRDRALQIEKSIPKNGNAPILNNSWPVNNNGDSITFLTTDFQRQDLIKAEKEEGKFYDTESLWPKDQPSLEIGFDADYMIKLCQQFKKIADSRRTIVKLSLYDESHAMQMETKNNSTGQEIKALLMPCTF